MLSLGHTHWSARDARGAVLSLTCPRCRETLRYVATKRERPALSLYVCLSDGLFAVSAHGVQPVSKAELSEH